MGLLTVFANFRIDSEERLLRMQDSLRSFCEADIEKWVVNIRGPLKREAADFLRTNLDGRLKLFELESKKGWFHDSRQMLPEISSEYVFFWIEDHICMSGPDYLNKVTHDIASHKIDFTPYSSCHKMYIRGILDSQKVQESTAIFYFDNTREAFQSRIQWCQKHGYGTPYVLFMTGVFSLKLFTNIVSRRDPLFRRWDKLLPFDFEKSHTDTHWLPFRHGLPRQELFAPIDDSNGYEPYDLISRGLYPERVKRELLSEWRAPTTAQWNRFRRIYFSLLKAMPILSVILWPLVNARRLWYRIKLQF